jgi:hypothetical protein
VSRLSVFKKRGLNPTIPHCFYCNKPKNQRDAEAPHGVVIDLEPCDECEKWMRRGIILISIRDGETGTVNPHRTGKWLVITDEGVLSLMKPGPTRDLVLKKRFCFVEDNVWESAGLPVSKGDLPS